jgi:hypothetical protein
MPTPPFSQNRRDWLQEISGLFAKKSKETTSRAGILTVANPKAFESVTTICTVNSKDDASAKDQAMADRPRRLG